MAFYPTYQPVYPTFPIQQPQQQSIIWISGEREAQMYPVAPNNAVTLWSQTDPVVYLKSADATGKPTIKTYDLVERTQSAPAPVEDRTTSYATKDDLGEIMGALTAVKTDIETIKGDLYGIAGKKKVVKKEDE